MNLLANFCPNCGSPIEETAKFCTNCGGAIQSQQTPSSGNPANAQQASDSGKGEVRLGLPAPGFSDRVNHPEILAAVKKNRKASKIFLLFLIPIPIIGFLVYSFATGEMEPDKAALYGGIVSGVFLLFAIFSFLLVPDRFPDKLVFLLYSEAYRFGKALSRELPLLVLRSFV